MSDAPVPKWALERAAQLTNVDGSCFNAEGVLNTSIGTAFARYIAAYEPEPVDPLLIEAREIVIATTPQPQRNFEIRKAEIRRGWKDDGFCVQIALAALKRGMEMRAPLTQAMVEAAVDKAVTTWCEGRGALRDVLSGTIHAALAERQA